MVLDSLTFSLLNKNVYPNAPVALNTMVLTRDSSKLGQSVTVDFTMTLKSIIMANYYFQLSLPKSQLKTTNVDPVCKFIYGSGNTVVPVTCTLLNQDLT